MESKTTSHKYNIDYEEERQFWRSHVINKWITYSNKCPSCKLNSLTLKKLNQRLTPINFNVIKKIVEKW